VLGLRAGKRAAHESARMEVSREIASILADLQSGVSALRESASAPRIYLLLPTPAEVTPAQQLYEEAGSAPPAESAALLARVESEFPDATTASGLPLLPLVKWAQLRAQAGSPELIASCLRAAVETHPSILTPGLLAHVEALLQHDPSGLALLESWRGRWQSDEEARAILRECKELTQQTSFPCWATVRGKNWWLERDFPERPIRLMSEHSLRQLAETAFARRAASFPRFADVRIRFQGHELRSGSDSREELQLIDRDGFQIFAGLIHPELLYAGQRQQLAWLSALLASAVGVAIAGFWVMQRALDRERQLNEMKSNFVASVSHELRAEARATETGLHKADRTEHMSRPERPERPQHPERIERPEKPEKHDR